MKQAKSNRLSISLLTIIGAAVTVGAVCLEANALPHDGFPEPKLPPIHPNPVISYYGQDVHAMYSQGVILRDPRHWGFANVRRDEVGPDEVETFDSILSGIVDVPGMGISGLKVTLTGPVTTRVFDKVGQDTGTFDTEIVSMSLTGGIGGMQVEIRENPNQQSYGRTTIADLGGGEWQIDSFFDVYTELSVTGGLFFPDNNAPGRMELCPEPVTLTLLAMGGLALLRRRRS